MQPTIQEQKRAILEKGIKAVLEESSIPQIMHLKMVGALKGELENYRSALSENQDAHAQSADEIAQHSETVQNTLSRVEEIVSRFEEEIERLTGITHLKGEPGDSVDPNEVIAALIPHLPQPEEIDKKQLVAEILDLIPAPEVKEVEPLDTESLFETFVSRIQKERLIDVSHIKNAESFIFNGTKYKIEELMNGAGGTSGGATKIANQVVTGVQVGNNTVIDLTTLSHTIDTLLWVSYQGQILTPGIPVDSSPGWTLAGTTLTVYNASASGAFLVQYTYA